MSKENPLYCLLLIISFSVSAASAATLIDSIDAQKSVQQTSAESQQIIDQINAKTTDSIYEYQQVSEQLSSLQIYNQQLKKLIHSQDELINTRKQQLNSIEQTEQLIVPLMLKMIETLEKFIQLDMPFLFNERLQRVYELQQLMDQADITSAEKYRQILEAFLVEMNYGRTIETWQGTHPDDQPVVVNYFRIGRVVLVYQSLDGKNAFYWSKENAQYVPLTANYRASLERGFRVARKQTVPEFLVLPVTIPVLSEIITNE